MGRLLCTLGLHRWKRRRTTRWESRTGGTIVYFEDACTRCPAWRS